MNALEIGQIQKTYKFYPLTYSSKKLKPPSNQINLVKENDPLRRFIMGNQQSIIHQQQHQMSSSQQQLPRSKSPKSPLRSNLSKNNSFNSPLDQNAFNSVNLQSLKSISEIPRQNSLNQSSVLQNDASLQEENKKLRRKLKELSQRLDQQLERAAQNKLKMQNLAKLQHPVKPQSQSLQLQNAYKMIQRLQKTVKQFQNKQSYQVSVKRIMDLQSIIKKKEHQTEVLKQQIKTEKKLLRQKQKLINELLQNAKKDKNVTEDKQLIERLKKKLKKVMEDNDMLRKKELTKHQQLVKAERRIVEMEQQDEQPIGREESLLQELQEMKKKYKQAMQRVDRLNNYIAKLNQKIDSQSNSDKSKARYSEGDKSKREISKSLDQLPSLKNNKVKPIVDLLEKHLPSPKNPIRLKRY